MRTTIVSALLIFISCIVLGQKKDKVVFNKVVYEVLGKNIESVRISEKSSKYLSRTNKNVSSNVQTIEHILDDLRTELLTKSEEEYASIGLNVKYDISMNRCKGVIADDILSIYSKESQFYLNFPKAYREKLKEEKRERARKYEEQSRKSHEEAMFKLRMREMSGHDFMTVFSVHELNFSQTRLSSFIYEHLKMSEVKNELDGNCLLTEYKTTVSFGEPQTLSVKYDLYMKESNYFVNSVNVSGDFDKVIELFVEYWPTNINMNNYNTNEWAYYYLLPDKVGLIVDENNNAKIEIVKSDKTKPSE